MRPSRLSMLVSVACVFVAGAVPVLAQQAPSGSSGWRQELRATGRTAYTRFVLVGKVAPPAQVDAATRPALALDCIPGKGSKGKYLSSHLLVGANLKIDYVEPEEIHGVSYFPMVTVLFHTDSAKDRKEQWSAGAENTSASIPKDVLKKILHAHTLAVSADDDQGAPIAMRFEIANPAQVVESCDLD